MRLSYHPATQRDGDALADRFYSDLMARLADIVPNPERFAHYLGHAVFRRARLRKFPHIIVFRVIRDRVRVTVIKHEKRDPAFGMGRK